MNSTQNYVINRKIDQLLVESSFIRWSVLLILAAVLTIILVNLFITDIRNTSKQLDNQMSETDSLLAGYARNRDQINHDYEQLMASTSLIAKLKEQFSHASSEETESWLIRTAITNNLQPSQIHINTKLLDEQGEFFRIVCKISGTYQDIQIFLNKTIRSEYFLIWEKLEIENFDSNQLGLTLSLKQYVSINDEYAESG